MRADSSTQRLIAATAAREIVETGLEMGPAKHRALKALGLPRSTALPDNDLVEDEVREYIAVFANDTQPQDLLQLRLIASTWMERLSEHRPHLSGAVWRGTATQHHDVWLSLFCDDAKATEIDLLNQRVSFEHGSTTGFMGREVDVLTLAHPVPHWGRQVLVHCVIHDFDDLRGALKPDAKGRSLRGDWRQLQALLQTESPQP